MRTLTPLLGLLLALPAAAQLQPFPYVANGAVFQRDAPIPIWGQAAADSEVSITFVGTVTTTAADASGRWRVDLPAQPAGGPFTLTIASGRQTRTVSDVYVGDVWLASGQSNMEWTLGQALGGPAEAASANDPLLRQFRVPKGLADDPSDTLPNGAAWSAATSAASARNFSAVAYYAARDLRETLGIPIGILNASYGGSRIETWMSEAMLGYDEQDVTLANGEAERQPTVAWNKMVHPLLGIPVRGVMWYQGESNADTEADAQAYGDLFQTMIAGWRSALGDDDLPFLWVQLPNFGPPQTVEQGAPPTYHAWPILRAQQSRALALPHTAEVVSLDTGLPDANGAVDIHPTNKRPVGERLALAAREVAYGEDLVASGPRYASNELLDDGRVAISFTDLGGGLASADGTLDGFTLAGADRQFVWAEAEIQGDRVIVSAASVPEPTAVRYAYQYNPGNPGEPGTADLTNAAGLPASPLEAVVNPGFSIAEFAAARATIESGQSTILSWQVFEAASVTLDGTPVDAASSRSVSPTETTTYTLQATSGDGETLSETVTVEVLDPSLIDRADAQPATASTVEACCGDPLVAAFAVDDDLTTRWSSAWSDGRDGRPEDPNYDGTPDDEWLAVDLGGVYDVDRVILTWEAAYATVYELQTSFDGVSWTTVYREDAGDGDVDDVALTTPSPARHLRMLGIDRVEIAGQRYGYSLFDLAVYGEASSVVPPSASVAPRTGTVIAAGAQTTLVADVTGSVQTATFLVGGESIGTVDAAPFEIAWTPTVGGRTEVVVIVTDQAGITVQSAPTTVYVDDGSIVRYEAEDATLTGGSDSFGHTPLTSSAAASGGAYLDLREQWRIDFAPVSVGTAGPALVTIGYQTTYESPKTQILVVNGVEMPVVFTSPDNTTWMQLGVEVPLQDGDNAISLVGSWNYMSVDFLGVEDARPTATEESDETGSIDLEAPRPNPFGGATTLRYTLAAPSPVSLDVFDMAGRHVLTLVDGERAAGTHTLTFSADGLADGTYIVRLLSDRASRTRRVALVR